MHDDLRLADALIVPDVAPPPTAGETVLVTGATGFLGRHVVRELLASGDAHIVCLVRGPDRATAASRLAAALRAAGAPEAAIRARVDVVAGDVAAPQLGMDPTEHAARARDVTRVIHCAAEVNWSKSYARLRATNVIGALEALRFAVTGRAKAVTFVSSLAVCYADGGPAVIDETTDVVAGLAGMPLGYARSKAVAETLHATLAARGLPVLVVRPPLIAGDSATGASNPDDLFSALVAATADRAVAMDADWRVDCVPVDAVARIVARLRPAPGGRPEVLHLTHDAPRHWRECVLWMNLAGHPVRLVQRDAWMAAMFPATGRTRLHGYRHFFRGIRGGGQAPFELYLEPTQRRIAASRSRAALAAAGLALPPIDAALMRRYFDHFEAVGAIPRPRSTEARPAHGTTAGRAATPQPPDAGGAAAAIGAILRTNPGMADAEVLAVTPRDLGPSLGILTELAAARPGSVAGIRRYRVLVRMPGGPAPHELDLVLKAKPCEREMQQLAVEVAALCDPALGDAFDRFRDDLGIVGANPREIALYAIDAPGIRAHRPEWFGALTDADSGATRLAMAFVEGEAADDAGAIARPWPPARVAAALAALGAIHATHYDAPERLAALAWPAPRLDPTRMLRLAPLWDALRAHAAVPFAGWAGERLAAIHASLVRDLSTWWPRLRALPRTLVHNDFNPRNVIRRRADAGGRLCAFDWELAADDVPQHDLAELLCFVADPAWDAEALGAVVDGHRAALERERGIAIDARDWRAGFALALRHLLVDRLPAYTMIDRFRPQAYLGAVARNWLRLHDLADRWAR